MVPEKLQPRGWPGAAHLRTRPLRSWRRAAPAASAAPAQPSRAAPRLPVSRRVRQQAAHARQDGEVPPAARTCYGRASDRVAIPVSSRPARPPAGHSRLGPCRCQEGREAAGTPPACRPAAAAPPTARGSPTACCEAPGRPAPAAPPTPAAVHRPARLAHAAAAGAGRAGVAVAGPCHLGQSQLHGPSRIRSCAACRAEGAEAGWALAGCVLLGTPATASGCPRTTSRTCLAHQLVAGSAAGRLESGAGLRGPSGSPVETRTTLVPRRTALDTLSARPRRRRVHRVPRRRLAACCAGAATRS